MASDSIKIPAELNTKLSIAMLIVKSLLRHLNDVEANPQMPDIEKLSEIKKIREELDKVGMEIDIIKNDIILLKTRHINWGTMPTYLYECPTHGEFEYQHSITEELEFCPKCEAEAQSFNGRDNGKAAGEGYVRQKVKKLISGGTNFILMGGGWAKDSYR